MPSSAKRESQSQYVLLGLLKTQPGTGYELRQRIEGSIGFFWSESWGQIYPTLRSLAKEKLISGEMRAGRGKPDARVYSITRKGREVLRDWVRRPPREESPRNETLLKLFFTNLQNTYANHGMLRSRLANYEKRLSVFKRLEKALADEHPGHPQLMFWQMTVRYGQMKAEAEIAWCNECLQLMYDATDAETDRMSGYKRKK